MNGRTAKLIHQLAVRLGISDKLAKRRWLALSQKERAAAARIERR